MTLTDRAAVLQDLLAFDGIQSSLEECETLLVADLIEKIRAQHLTSIGAG